MIWVSQYSIVRVTMKKSNVNDDGNIESRNIPVCLMLANTSATTAFFLLLVLVFFIVPLLLLVVLYSVIVRHLILDHSRASSTSENYHARARKQVILMLLTVVFSFFVCLAPFKTLTFYLVLAPPENVQAIDNDTLLNIVYFCRIMFYLNSAINPILYNLMSTKFRIGFFKICGLRKRRNSDRSTIRSTLNATRISRRIVNEHQEDFLWHRATVAQVPIVLTNVIVKYHWHSYSWLFNFWIIKILFFHILSWIFKSSAQNHESLTKFTIVWTNIGERRFDPTCLDRMERNSILWNIFEQ